MSAIFFILLDVILIGLLVAGIVYALRLNQNLTALRSSRAEMERFVMEFSGTVTRAETSIKGLKQAARDCGDDLEQLIERSQNMRDELRFLIESADQIADRLSQTAAIATNTTRPEKVSEIKKPAAPLSTPQEKAEPKIKTTASTSAERDLMKALEKMG